MRNILASILFLLLISQTVCGQKVVKRTYKKFTDTTFNTGDIILAPEILFSLSSCEILPGAKDSVDVIANFSKKHPTFKIEVGVHTDLRGKAKANVILSECRANSVVGYLTKELMLPVAYFVAKGYGGSQPIISQTEIDLQRAKCHHCENLHKKNRRVEIKILKT